MQPLGSLFTLPRFVKEANVKPDNRGSEAEKPASTRVKLNSGKEDVMFDVFSSVCLFFELANWLSLQ